MRIEVTPQRFGRVDVAITDPHREVECDAPFVSSDCPDDVSPTDLVAGGDQTLGEVRVRRPHTAVIDGHRAVPDNNTAERHDPVP